MKRLLILAAFVGTAVAQIPVPQLPLTGNIGAAFAGPVLNGGNLVMTADANYTMAYPDMSAFVIKVTSTVSLTATRNLISPNGFFSFIIENATMGSQSVQIIGTSGTGFAIPNGQSCVVIGDSTNYVSAGCTSSGSGGSGVSSINGNTGSMTFTGAGVSQSGNTFTFGGATGTYVALNPSSAQIINQGNNNSLYLINTNTGNTSVTNEFIQMTNNGRGYDCGNNGSACSGWSTANATHYMLADNVRGIFQPITINAEHSGQGDTAAIYGYARQFGGSVASSDESVNFMVGQLGQKGFGSGTVTGSPAVGAISINTNSFGCNAGACDGAQGGTWDDGGIIFDKSQPLGTSVLSAVVPGGNGGVQYTIPIETPTATGSSGASTITVSSATGIAIGNAVSGTGIGSGAQVDVSYTGTTTVPLTVINSGAVSGTVTIGGVTPSSAWGNIVSCTNNGNGQYQVYTQTTCLLSIGAGTFVVSGSQTSCATNPPIGTSLDIGLVGGFQEEAYVVAVAAPSGGQQSITFCTRYAWNNSFGGFVGQGGPVGQAIVSTSTLSSWPIAFAIAGATSSTVMIGSNCDHGACFGAPNLPTATTPITLEPMAFIIGSGVNGAFAALGTNHLAPANGDSLIGAPTSSYNQVGIRLALNQTTFGIAEAIHITDNGPFPAIPLHATGGSSGGGAPEGIYLDGYFGRGVLLSQRPTQGPLIGVGNGAGSSFAPYQIFSDNTSFGVLTYSPSPNIFTFSGEVIAPTVGVGSTPPTGCSTTGCIALAEAGGAGTPTANVDYLRASSSTHKIVASLNGGAEYPLRQILTGTLTYTAATSDAVTITGITTSSTCSFEATNATAAAATVVPWYAVTTNTVTINHVATTASGGTVAIMCTVN